MDGVRIKALAQVGKQGFVYVLNRETGAPAWPIPEVPMPPSGVPRGGGLPHPARPHQAAPSVCQGSERQDLLDQAAAQDYDTGPLYRPPTIRGLIITPGEGGGANRGAAACDPVSQTLYVAGFAPP